MAWCSGVLVSPAVGSRIGRVLVLVVLVLVRRRAGGDGMTAEAEAVAERRARCERQGGGSKLEGSQQRVVVSKRVAR